MNEMAQLVDGIEGYCTDAVILARLEAGDAARSWVRDAALWAACAALLGLGYALAMAGVVSALAPALGLPGALLSVGGANALAGGLGGWALLSRPRGEAARAPGPTATEGGL